MSDPLGEFEGRKITKTTIAITGAGDGLSAAMKIDPQALHQGDTVYVLIEATVGKITFDPYDDGVAARVQNLKAGVSLLVGADLAKTTIEAQRDALKRASDAERGQGDFLSLASDHDAGLHDTPAPGCPVCVKVEVAALVDAHNAGEHASGLVDGCPPCDSEAELAIAEQAAEAPADDGKVKPIGSRSRKRAAAKEVPAE